MKRSVDIVSILLLVTAVGCFGVAGWMYYQDSITPKVKWLVVAQNIDLGESVLGVTRPVSVEIHNPHPTATVQIMGSEMGCSLDGCLALEGLPCEVPPKGSVPLKGGFTPSKEGAFDAVFNVFSNVPNQMKTPVHYVGVGIVADKPETSTTPESQDANESTIAGVDS